jgi:multicomponent Na+:H+ antiporter subunit B
MSVILIDVALFSFLLLTAFAIVRLRNLFAVTMLTSVFSLLSAGLFVTLDAVDVAFTEAAVAR